MEPTKLTSTVKQKPTTVRLLAGLASLLPNDEVRTAVYLRVVLPLRKVLKQFVLGFYRIDHIYEVLRRARTVYPLLRANCDACHGASGPGAPQIAHADSATAWSAVVDNQKVNFTSPSQSRLVRRLAAVFETVTPFLRAVAHDRQRTVGDGGRRALDAIVRAQIDAALAEHLTARPSDTADILAAVLSVAAWSHMRSIQGHGVERAAALLESVVLRVLDEPS